MIGVNACSVCSRRDPLGPTIEVDGLETGTCEAFPDGIPVDIASGDHAHRVPYADEELLWDGVEEEFQSYVEAYENLVGDPPEGLPEGET